MAARQSPYSLGETRRHKVRPCAHCGSLNDASAGLMEKGKPIRPTPGSVSICLKCGELSIYDENLDLRKPTDDEYIEMAHDPAITLARKSWMGMERTGVIDLLSPRPAPAADCILSMKNVKPR